MDRTSGKRAKQQKRGSKSLLILILTAILAVLIVVALLIPKSTPDHPTGTNSTTGLSAQMEQMVIHSIEEQGELVRINTSYGTVSYPFAYSDLITVDPVTETGRVGLAFQVNLNGNLVPIYTLWIHGDAGVICGLLDINGVTYPVRMEFMSVPENLDQGHLLTFYAAQETVNDVITSLKDNPNYSE